MAVEGIGADDLLARIEELERLLAERTAQLEAANKELEAFSYSVSHDLRAPLRHVGGFSKLLLESVDGTDGATAQYARAIADAAQRMGKLIDDLLALSRAGSAELQFEDVDLNALIGEVRQECVKQAGARDIEWKVGELPRVRGDPAMLRTALAHLLSNAVKFTAKRSTAMIEIEASRKETGEIVLCVRDNGAGFDMRYVGRLFGMFQRLHREDEFEGRGAGLAIVQRIVRRHGGRVWAEGESGRGAVFYVALNELGPR
jgi:light-regulated signal transduction histidine kinase (bacteriophytochrome)